MSGDSIEVESESVDSVLPSFETSDQRSESNSIPVGSGDVFECQSNSGNFVGSAELYDAEVRLFLPDGGSNKIIVLFGFELGSGLLLDCFLGLLSGGFIIVLNR